MIMVGSMESQAFRGAVKGRATPLIAKSFSRLQAASRYQTITQKACGRCMDNGLVGERPAEQTRG